MQHQVHGLVVDGGHGDAAAAVWIGRAGRGRIGDALEERELVRGEQLAVAWRHVQRAVRDAEIDGAEQREQAAVRAVAARHGVREGAGVGGQLVMQGQEREVLGVQRVLGGEQAVVLGIEDKDQAQHEGQEACVDVVAAAIGIAIGGAQRVAGGAGARGVAGLRGLEAGEQEVQGLQHLLGEVAGDLALGLARGGQQLGQLLVRGDAEPLARVQEHDQRIEQGAAGGGDQICEAEGEGAGGGAVRRVQEAQVGAVAQKADGHAGVAQQALELGGRRIVPGAGDGLALVERQAGRQVPGQGQRLRGLGAGVAHQRAGGAQELAGVGQGQGEALGERLGG